MSLQFNVDGLNYITSSDSRLNTIQYSGQLMTDLQTTGEQLGVRILAV